jgi:hypothetical protein
MPSIIKRVEKRIEKNLGDTFKSIKRFAPSALRKRHGRHGHAAAGGSSGLRKRMRVVVGDREAIIKSVLGPTTRVRYSDDGTIADVETSSVRRRPGGWQADAPEPQAEPEPTQDDASAE